MTFHFTNSKLKAKHFSTNELIKKYQILKSMGSKHPLQPLYDAHADITCCRWQHERLVRTQRALPFRATAALGFRLAPSLPNPVLAVSLLFLTKGDFRDSEGEGSFFVVGRLVYRIGEGNSCNVARCLEPRWKGEGEGGVCLGAFQKDDGVDCATCFACKQRCCEARWRKK